MNECLSVSLFLCLRVLYFRRHRTLPTLLRQFHRLYRLSMYFRTRFLFGSVWFFLLPSELGEKKKREHTLTRTHRFHSFSKQSSLPHRRRRRSVFCDIPAVVLAIFSICLLSMQHE